MLADARTSVPTDGMRLDGSTIAHWMGIDKRAPYPAAPHHPSIVVAVPCAGQQGTCSQQPANVSLQTLMYKDVGRHKARPLQLLIIEKNDYRELPQSVLAPLGQTVQGCWPAQGSATTTADYRNRMITGNFPSLFSLRSPKLGLWISQPLRG